MLADRPFPRDLVSPDLSCLNLTCVLPCMRVPRPTMDTYYPVRYRPPWTVEEGGMTRFLVQDLRLALVVKTLPHRPQALKGQ